MQKENKQEINKNWFDDCFVPVETSRGKDLTGAVLYKPGWF